MYDANIFASMFDVRPPEIRGTVVGVMNMAGWLLAMLWGIVFFNYADRQALAAVIPLLRDAWHLTPVQEGMLGSAFAWTSPRHARSTSG